MRIYAWRTVLVTRLRRNKKRKDKGIFKAGIIAAGIICRVNFSRLLIDAPSQSEYYNPLQMQLNQVFMRPIQ